jgi:hypothetical protein
MVIFVIACMLQNLRKKENGENTETTWSELGSVEIKRPELPLGEIFPGPTWKNVFQNRISKYSWPAMCFILGMTACSAPFLLLQNLDTLSALLSRMVFFYKENFSQLLHTKHIT